MRELLGEVLRAIGPIDSMPLRDISGPPPRGTGRRFQHSRFVTPNIGRNHPDYGKPLAEHVANKLARSGRAY